MNTVKTLLILAMMLLISGCGTKTPFKSQEPLEGAALVYVYVANVQSSMDYSMEDSKYKVQINGKNVRGTMEAGEHKVFDMKPGTVLFTAVRRNIETSHVKLNLQAGKMYFLKAQSGNFGGSFTFERVDDNTAREDLQSSKLAGSFEADMAAYVPDFAGSTAGNGNEEAIPALTEAQIDAIIEKKLAERTTVAPTTSVAPMQKATPSYSSTPKLSKMDEIQRAFEMKEKGMLTHEEFTTIKAEILAK